MNSNMNIWSGCFLLSVFLTFDYSGGVELTFELPDNAKECFYEEIKKNTSAILEFQVVTGGQYDVDVSLESPQNVVIYQQIKSQFDSHQFVAPVTGIYKVCFSNEFSTFSHKLVYMDFQAGPEPTLPGIGDHTTVLTQLESSAQEIHQALNKILDYQTHHRLREAQGRKRAEDINERVHWWSIGESIAIVVISVGQVLVLKNFFTDRPSASYGKL